MSRFHQQGEQFKPKHKTGSVDEEYLDRDEMAAARKAIMKYKLKDPGPSLYSKRKSKKKSLKK
jgi:hypothetical protein